MNSEKNSSRKNEKSSTPKGKKIILPPSVEEKMKNEVSENEKTEEAVGETEKLKEKLAKSEKEIKTLNKEYLLLQAEFSNFQKRLRKNDEERAKYALQPFASSLLSHIDAFEQALTTDSKADAQKILDGFMLIYKGIAKAFNDFEIKVILPEKGEVINLEFHEVMLTAEDAELSNNTVFEVIQKGYMLFDRVLRPGKVVAVKNPKPKKVEIETAPETTEVIDAENIPDLEAPEIIEDTDTPDENTQSDN